MSTSKALSMSAPGAINLDHSTVKFDSEIKKARHSITTHTTLKVCMCIIFCKVSLYIRSIYSEFARLVVAAIRRLTLLIISCIYMRLQIQICITCTNIQTRTLIMRSDSRCHTHSVSYPQ